MSLATSSYGERRQLTIVFSDIIGSTELSAQLDPEGLARYRRPYHQSAAGVVKRFEGHVAPYLGDGILILFGYPRAHKSDAEHAIRTGLSILDKINSPNELFLRNFEKRISVRFGIHTGEVMVRQEGAIQKAFSVKRQTLPQSLMDILTDPQANLSLRSSISRAIGTIAQANSKAVTPKCHKN